MKVKYTGGSTCVLWDGRRIVTGTELEVTKAVGNELLERSPDKWAKVSTASGKQKEE